MRLLDLFCGRWGWSRAFAARGWECVGVDLVEPPDPPGAPQGFHFRLCDVLLLKAKPRHIWIPVHGWIRIDALASSSPCEDFSLFGMRHFHPEPPYPESGIKLFNHARALAESAGVPYIMENVRHAQDFVGRATDHCGPFYLWGSLVPPLLPQGIRKNMVMGNSKLVNELKRSGDREAIKKYRRQFDLTWNSSKSKERKEATAKAATIPPELANCVADYAERILEQKNEARGNQ